MTKIECIIQPIKLGKVQAALSKVGVRSMRVSEVHEDGHRRKHTGLSSGIEYSIDFAHKLKIEIVVPGEDINKVVEAVKQAAATDGRNRVN